MAFKFDFFPAAAFPLGIEELDRAVWMPNSGLSEAPAPFVTPEDILVAKLHWFRLGGEVSEVQWRDIQGIVRNRGASLDRQYLVQGAEKPGIVALLERADTSPIGRAPLQQRRTNVGRHLRHYSAIRSAKEQPLRITAANLRPFALGRKRQ
jgi:hypothetical protein